MIKINFNGHFPLNEINLLHEYEEREDTELDFLVSQKKIAIRLESVFWLRHN